MAPSPHSASRTPPRRESPEGGHTVDCRSVSRRSTRKTRRRVPLDRQRRTKGRAIATSTDSRRGETASGEPAGAPDLLAFLNRVPERDLQHRPRHFIAAHSEDGADEALDAEPKGCCQAQSLTAGPAA